MKLSPFAASTRWPWILGLVAALIVVWRGEARRAAATRPAPAARSPSSALRGSSLGKRLREQTRSLLRRKANPRPPGLVRVSGRVHDALSGESIAGATVVFESAVGERAIAADDSGQYTIELPADRYRPSVRAAHAISLGRLPSRRQPGRPRVDDLTPARAPLAPLIVVDQDIDGLDLEVSRSATIHGFVHDRSGHPIGGALIRAEAEDDPELQPVLGSNLAQSDGGGHFELVLPAKQHQVTAFHDRYTARERPIVDLDPDETYELDLTMISGCIVTGTVTLDGSPVDDAAIERAPNAANPDAFKGTGVDTHDGRFVWSTDEEGELALRAYPLAAPPSAPQTVACHDGARPEVTFAVVRGTPALAGTVVNARGAPVAQAFLEISQLPDYRIEQKERADAQGAWAFAELPPGTYRIVAKAPGEGLAVATVDVPGADVRLSLSGTGALAGTTRGLEDGAFTLEVSCTESRGFWKYTEERFVAVVRGGQYRVDGVPACAARVRGFDGPWQANGAGSPRFPDVTIPPGGVARLDLDLSPIVRMDVHGFVHDPAGRPVARAQVRVVDQPGLRTLTDARGTFAIRGAPGARLVITGDGVSATVELARDGAPAVDIDVPLDPAAAPRR